MEKKEHTVKNNIVSNFLGEILYLSLTYEGKRHDKGICNGAPFEFPVLKVGPRRFLWQGTGYQGHQVSNCEILQPIKKKKGEELTELQKKFNQSISKFRVHVEHAIGGAKRLRVVKDCFRNYRERVRDTVMEVACGLHNFRISLRTPREMPVFASQI